MARAVIRTEAKVVKVVALEEAASEEVVSEASKLLQQRMALPTIQLRRHEDNGEFPMAQAEPFYLTVALAVFGMSTQRVVPESKILQYLARQINEGGVLVSG